MLHCIRCDVKSYALDTVFAEKLSLLDYENAFCKGWKHQRISRVYFAHPPIEGIEDDSQRIHKLYDMAYWLMSLNKDQVSTFHLLVHMF